MTKEIVLGSLIGGVLASVFCWVIFILILRYLTNKSVEKMKEEMGFGTLEDIKATITEAKESFSLSALLNDFISEPHKYGEFRAMHGILTGFLNGGHILDRTNLTLVWDRFVELNEILFSKSHTEEMQRIYSNIRALHSATTLTSNMNIMDLKTNIKLKEVLEKITALINQLMLYTENFEKPSYEYYNMLLKFPNCYTIKEFIMMLYKEDKNKDSGFYVILNNISKKLVNNTQDHKEISMEAGELFDFLENLNLEMNSTDNENIWADFNKAVTRYAAHKENLVVVWFDK